MSQSDKTPTQDSVSIKFSDLALSPSIHKAIADTGYETPTPIQAQAIPYLLDGRDILGVAQTGTGKTAAFALPILSKIKSRSKTPQVLCLAPTRELAIQVAEAFQSYARYIKDFHVLPIYGGTEYGGQIRQLKRGVDVVVGTPGRVMDHVRKGTLKLDELKTLVLDEADEMLRMGFIDDVEWILEQMPDEHQTALFSATMPRQIKNITKKYLKDPAEVTIKQKTTTATTIRQRFLQMNNNEKLDTLTRVMEVEEFDAMIIFVRTKNATLEVAERLQARGYSAQALNGDIAQNQREKTVNRLKKGDIDIIVATDVAARGLDVERISHVVNYDVPYDTESYVHRIGRTGRAGRSGDAILFVNGREKRMLQAIERTTRQRIDRFIFPSLEVLNERKMEQLFLRIDAELQKDLTEYRSVIQQYMERTEVKPELLAAAMTSLEYDSQPFYIKEIQRKPAGKKEKRTRESASSDEGRRGRREQRDRKDRKPQRERSDDSSMDTYRLEVGETHGASKGDIVGAIANEAGIDSEYIGKINIFDTHSFVDLPQDMPKEIYKTLRKVWVRGQQLQISLGGGKRSEGRKPRRTLELSSAAGAKRSAKPADARKKPKSKSRKPSKPKR